MAIYDDNLITINLNELVEIRAKLLTQYEDHAKEVATGEYLDENDVDQIATKLRETLTWDTLYYMVDGAILEYLDKPDPNKPHYGETAGNEPAATFERAKGTEEIFQRAF
tara:strand:+ start:2137 stop:2466 length:330 start_codon:yes stop_codon:yes gene_type:complete